MNLDEIKKNYIDGLVATKAFIVKGIDEEPFTLRSGKQSYMFLDHSRVASSPESYKAFIEGISYLLKEVYGSKDFVLCNVDSKISAQMVGSLAYSLNKPQIIFKSKELTSVEKGTKQQLTGDENWNLPVAIPDDVMTGGDGTAKNVADLIKDGFPRITDIQIYVGFIRDPKPSSYTTHYLLTRDELIDILWKTFSEKQHQAIIKERENT